MAILQVNNLCKKFGKTQVLNNVSFSLERGEVLSIIGSSGGGKTTLLRCLNFLETADSGEILVDSNTIFNGNSDTKLSDEEIRKNRLHFGLVFQSFNLFPQYNVLQNVMLAPSLLKVDTNENLEIKARDLIERVGLTEKINNYPCQLSGGQQQRVAIARALALEPHILCFDEPTSALDPELTGEVLKVIRDLRETGKTMIIVTHEMKFAKSVSDKVMFLSEGKVEEFGTPSEVFDNPESEKTKSFLNSSLENL